LTSSNKGKNTVLLAGSSGTIGSALLIELLKKKYDVVCPVRTLSDNANKISATYPKAKIVLADISKSNCINFLISKHPEVDVVISCIGSRNGTYQEAVDVEYNANMNLLQIAENLNASQFIMLSAICVQKPVLQFHKYKLDFEEALKKSNIKHTIIRPTAFFKSLAGQIKRVKEGKSFIVFDNGTKNSFKPISESDLSKYIASKILDASYYNKLLIVGGPGPAISPRYQGKILFKAAGRPEKFLSIPSVIFKILCIVISPLTIFSNRIRDFREFLKIALFYATESMLVWDSHTKSYRDGKTPEFGKDTLEEFYIKSVDSEFKKLDLANKRLF